MILPTVPFEHITRSSLRLVTFVPRTRPAHDKARPTDEKAENELSRQ